MKINGFEVDVYNQYNIQEDAKYSTCPKCSHTRKKSKDKCLSVYWNSGLAKCNHCGEVLQLHTYKGKQMNYEKPNTSNQTQLSDAHLQHFSKRLIRQDVLIRNKVNSANGNWFAFNYFEGNEIVKVKYKTPSKKMMASKNSKPFVYKYNDLVGQDTVMVCEGEEETLIWEQAGFIAACSVDMGAPNVNDSSADSKLQCITNCFDVFESAKLIYIAVDNDPNGERLEKELVRRFGAEKCKIVDFEDCKDANDYVFKHSEEELINLLNKAKDVKVDGIFSASDIRKEIINEYLYGQAVGTTTHFPQIDQCWKWRLGEVNVWTGYNNEGKSLFLKQLQILKSIGDGWKHAVFSPEEVPLTEWYTDLIESYVGKSADKNQIKYQNYMTKMELEDGIDFVDKYFYNVYPEEDHSLESLMNSFSYCVRKFDVKTITFDPYNQIHHLMKSGEREDLYISRFMSELKRFAVTHMVSVNLVAHQVTPNFEKGSNYPQPNLYKVKGGGTFADKADNVLIIWRENRNTDFTDTSVKFISQKIKKQKLTGIPGDTVFDFNRMTNRYVDENHESPIEKLKQNNVPVQEEMFQEDCPF